MKMKCPGGLLYVHPNVAPKEEMDRRCCLWCTFFLGAVSLAVPITVPTDLNPGDPYVLAFVSSTVRDGTSSNIGDYNNFVQGLADTAGIGQAQGLTWKAIASTATVDARDNVGNFGNVPVYLLDGTTVIADSFSDLWARVWISTKRVWYRGSEMFGRDLKRMERGIRIGGWEVW